MPIAANRLAAARPMPLAAPVTTATRPAAMAGWFSMGGISSLGPVSLGRGRGFGDVVIEEGRAIAVPPPQDRKEAFVHGLVAHSFVAVVDVTDIGRMKARLRGHAVADGGPARPV